MRGQDLSRKHPCSRYLTVHISTLLKLLPSNKITRNKLIMIRCILSNYSPCVPCVCMLVHSSCMRLHVCFGALQWAVYVWYWVELRTAALGIQCYCCRGTLRQSSGKSRWAFHVEKIMTSLQSKPDISWTRTRSQSLISVSFELCYLTIAPTVSLLTFLTSLFISLALMPLIHSAIC